MNHQHRFRTTATAVIIMMMLLLSGLTAGCKSNQEGSPGEIPDRNQLKVGYIDSDKLLANYEPYRSFLPDKEKHASQVRELLTSGKKITPEEEKYIKDTTLDYMSREEELLGRFVERVRAASEIVASEKKLDIIINNPDSGEVIEFGGIDVTSEVQVKLSQNAGKSDPDDDQG